MKLLARVHIPRCYFPKDVQVASLQLHGFCNASEDAYSGVIYTRVEETDGKVHIALVTSKTRVAPIKRLSIPRLELCGAHLLAKLLSHVRDTLKDVMAWTDSTIVINWLDGNPRRFKTYVGNRISFIITRIPPRNWHHVRGEQHPADCASRGLYPLLYLTTDAFISTLRRLVTHRGKLTLLWSDHGSNFVGAQQELKELEFLEDQKNEECHIPVLYLRTNQLEVYPRAFPALWWVVRVMC